MIYSGSPNRKRSREKKSQEIYTHFLASMSSSPGLYMFLKQIISSFLLQVENAKIELQQ